MNRTGFTLVEVLVALVILSLVMTTSLAVFFERERRLKAAEEIILVWQALANEAEIVRSVPYHELAPGETGSFRSDLEVLDSLRNLRTATVVEQWQPGVKKVSLVVRWGEREREERLVVVRSDTGGGSLW